MGRRAFFAVAGFFALGVTLSAQEATPNLSLETGAERVVQTPATAGATVHFAALNDAWYGPAALTLSDEALFSFPNAFAWMEAAPAEYLPAATLAETPRLTTSPATRTREVASRPVDLLPKFDYASSEVGVFYGKSTGKYGREVKAGYILSEIVEGDTHISVAISYQEASGRTPRLGR